MEFLTAHVPAEQVKSFETRFAAAHDEEQHQLEIWLAAKKSGDATGTAAALTAAEAAQIQGENVRLEASKALQAAAPANNRQRAGLYLHHVYPPLPAERTHRLAGDRFLCRGVVVEGRGTECAGLRHHRGFLPARVQEGRERCPLRFSLALVHRVLGPGGNRRGTLRQFVGKPHPGGEHFGVSFVRRAPGIVPDCFLS